MSNLRFVFTWWVNQNYTELKRTFFPKLNDKDVNIQLV